MFDVIVHLLGQQKLPILFGIRQFDCKNHLFVTTDKYSAADLKGFLSGKNWSEVVVDAFNPKDVYQKIGDILQSEYLGCKVGFNLTSGTKLMSAGASEVCRHVKGAPFYFNTDNNELLYLDLPFQSEPIKPIDKVTTYIQINTDHLNISNKGDVDMINFPERQALTRLIWDYRAAFAKQYRSIMAYKKRGKEGRDYFQPFDVEIASNITVCFDQNNAVRVVLPEQTFYFENWPDFPEYILGKWFEEYTYLMLKPYEERGIIKDLRVGLKLSFCENEFQDFDVLFTDGRRLYIVECKAGKLSSDHLVKLESIVQKYGGSKAVGLITACFWPGAHPTLKKRVQDSEMVEGVFAGNYFHKNLQSYMENLSK